MSIILDALKKSETERQQQGNTEFGQVPLRSAQRRTPLWIWIVAILLAINFIVLLGMFFRSTPQAVVDAPPEPTAIIATPVVTEPAAATFAEQIERVEPVVVREPASPPPAEPRPSVEAESNPSVPTVVEQLASGDTNVPDIDQLRVSGQLSIGEQRLDIHVYSESPANRFVFINMTKLRQGETTNDGVTVEEITQDGVILSYQGRRFFQARQ